MNLGQVLGGLPLLMALAGPALAQDFPQQSVTLISPNNPGGANDTVARIFVDELSKELGQTVVVENIGGAGGVIGAQTVAEAEPDGHTLLVASVSTHSFAPLTKPDLAYDPIEDFAPVSLLATVPNLLVANAELGAESVDDLVAMAKERPGELNYASGGIGSTSHFAIAMFVSLAGIADETVHIPYDGGAASMTATAAGETQFYMGPIPGMLPLIESGKVVPLAITGDERSELLPEVPTVAEAGLPEYTAFGWFGLMAPAGTPTEAIDTLSAAVNKAAESPAVVDALAAQSVEPASNSPEEFAAFIQEQLDSYRQLVTDGVVQVE